MQAIIVLVNQTPFYAMLCVSEISEYHSLEFHKVMQLFTKALRTHHPETSQSSA